MKVAGAIQVAGGEEVMLNGSDGPDGDHRVPVGGRGGRRALPARKKEGLRARNRHLRKLEKAKQWAPRSLQKEPALPTPRFQPRETPAFQNVGE